jgi:signal transduction histidine kinase/CheY-like chemotaxis protein
VSLQSLRMWAAQRTDHESDPEFRALIAALLRNRMLYAGLFGIVLTVVHVSMHRFLLGRTLAWAYAGPGESGMVVLWDKVFIVALCAATIAVSRRPLPLGWARVMCGALVLGICLAILLDDVFNRDVSFSGAYFALVLMVTVLTIPFKPWQTLALGAATVGTLALGIQLMPLYLGISGLTILSTQMIYLAMVVVVLTGITSLLYRYQFVQFDGRRNAEALNRSLEERTRALEQEKQRTEEQAALLMQMEELKSRFFSNVTHQFRTPLTLILGPAREALQERFGTLDPGLHRHLEIVHRSATQLEHLIDQLLDLSRLDSGGMHIEPERADLQRFLRDLHAAFLPLAERAGVAFEYRTDRHELWCRFDADKLEKAISNLLSNAFKFTPPGGKVRLALRVGERVEVSVRDTGPGIPEAELPLVFDRFHQAPGAAAHVTGTGIGLSLAKELVELHGGTIRAESDVGFGTRMTVTLPLDPVPPDPLTLAYAPPPEEEAPVEAASAALADGEAPCVLVVDDSEDMRLYLRGHLEPKYRVMEAADGRVGLGLAQRYHPALVISDVLMPELDGIDLCRALKDHPATADIPVVLLTARTSDQAKQEGLEARADDYLFKPFSATELLTRAENLIELRRMLYRPAAGATFFTPTAPDVLSTDDELLENVRATIEKHLGNSNFGVEWLADEVALSARQLQRRLQASVRLSAAGLIRMMRLQRAAQLLERRAGTVSEIAYRVGFHDAEHFSRLFRQTYGLTPTQYAEQHAPLAEGPPPGGRVAQE